MRPRKARVEDSAPKPGDAKITATRTQLLVIVLAAVATTASVTCWPRSGGALTLMIQFGFVLVIAWRLITIMASQGGPPKAMTTPWLPPSELPRYSVVVALYDETEILPHLIGRLETIEYPADLLDGYLVLEAHDQRTIETARSLTLPSWMQILIAPPGAPTTKPRALNHALQFARGDLLTVYDAEDDPDPLQLQEAAGRFRTADEDMVCFQAPLRIRRQCKSSSRSGFLDRQFAAEYAALFEITLPAMARMGLPFPWGGTSNHFRISALQALGGWDAWNVTEDADLGFRIWRRGWRSGVLSRPTYEPPPGELVHWLPQRTRWLKGYLQTLLVHTRSISGMGWRGWTALALTLGVASASAALHALSIAWICVFFLMSLLASRLPDVPWLGLVTLVTGAAAAVLTAAIGARRAGIHFSPWDMLAAPIYWSLLSLAFAHAAVRLIMEPHRWDKTAHSPDIVDKDASAVPAQLVTESGRAAA